MMDTNVKRQFVSMMAKELCIFTAQPRRQNAKWLSSENTK